jgi:hypothetical protein
VDTFEVEALDLGVLKELTVKMDGSGAGSAWKLDSVKVVDSMSKVTYEFPCEAWLDAANGTGTKVLTCATGRERKGCVIKVRVARPNNTDFECDRWSVPVQVRTGNAKGAGTDSNVELLIKGRNGDTASVRLDDESNANPFEKDALNVFNKRVFSVGDELQTLTVKMDGKGLSCDWQLEWISVGFDGGAEWWFPFFGWLGSSKGRSLSCELTASSEKPTAYKVTITTGSCRGAGTDANVFVVLEGTKSRTHEQQLAASLTNRNKFERSQQDVFDVVGVGLGELTKLHIRLDGSGIGSDWNLDNVVVEEAASKKQYVFVCCDWLKGAAPNKVLECGGANARQSYTVKVGARRVRLREALQLCECCECRCGRDRRRARARTQLWRSGCMAMAAKRASGLGSSAA